VESALDSIRYQQSLDEVWYETRRMLVDLGIQLAPADLESIGRGNAAGILVTLFTPVRQTAPDGAGGRALETGWHGRTVIRTRYRVVGSSDGSGSRVVITAIEEDATEHGHDSSRRSRAVELELDLARRLDPAAAARVEAALPADGG
jgi:hypothetical protein